MIHRAEYEMIASTFKEELEILQSFVERGSITKENFEARRESIRQLAFSLSVRFAENNPAFQHQKFMIACGF